MATSSRARFDLSVDDSVAASTTETDETAVISTGETWYLEVFGGSEVGAGDNIASQITLQEWDGATWTTVRLAGITSNVFEYPMKQSFVGDGTKKLRMRRVNKTGTAKRIAAYILGPKIPT